MFAIIFRTRVVVIQREKRLYISEELNIYNKNRKIIFTLSLVIFASGTSRFMHF